MGAAQRGDLFRAATIFNTLLQQRPHDPGAYIGLAEVQVRSGHLDEADAWLVRGLAVNPANGDLVPCPRHIALLQHRDRAAADFLVQAIALDPENPDSRRELAELYAGPLGQPAPAPRQAPPDRHQAAAAAQVPKPRISADLYYRLGPGGFRPRQSCASRTASAEGGGAAALDGRGPDRAMESCRQIRGRCPGSAPLRPENVTGARQKFLTRRCRKVWSDQGQS